MKLDGFENNETAWFNEIDGEFSVAAYQANALMEDYCHVEVGDNFLFAGIFDGFNGTRVANYISTSIWKTLKDLIEKNRNQMAYWLLRQAVEETEKKFLDVVGNDTTTDILSTAGSSCLITLIWEGTLYTANLGDSRVVIGTEVRDTSMLKVQQLTTDHSCENLGTRLLLRQEHPQDPSIIVKEANEWKVNGLKVAQTIGCACTKTKTRSLYPILQLISGQDVLSAKADISSRIIRGDDRCLILASRGFWEVMSNEDAILIVERHRRGIAKSLLRKALEKAAKKKNTNFKDVQSSAIGEARREFHDDITVIVVFLNQGQKKKILQQSYRSPPLA